MSDLAHRLVRELTQFVPRPTNEPEWHQFVVSTSLRHNADYTSICMTCVNSIGILTA